MTLSSGELRKRGFALGPRTHLNTAVGPHRAFVTLRIPLAEGLMVWPPDGRASPAAEA